MRAASLLAPSEEHLPQGRRAARVLQAAGTPPGLLLQEAAGTPGLLLSEGSPPPPPGSQSSVLFIFVQ